MKLTKKQTIALDFLEDNITKEVVFGGGAGGAKSVLGCYWLGKMCLKYPGTRWVMGRSVLKTLKETTLNSFMWVMGQQGLRATVNYRYNAQSNAIYFPGGSEILLKDLYTYPSDPNFDELGSLEITGAFVDECNQIDKKAWNILKSRIRYRLDEYGLSPKILGTCNPSKNWVYSDFFRPNQSGELNEGKVFIQALLTDNPFISSHYKENLLSLDTASKERLLYGNWSYDDDPSALIEYDAILDLYRNEHVQRTGKRYITFDVARFGRDSTVIMVWDGMTVIHCVELKKSDITEVAAKVRELANRFGVPMSRTVGDEDGVGCLTKGTMVLTGRGWIRIEDVSTEDVVYSKNEKNGIGFYPVTKNEYREETDVIELENGIEFSYSHFLPVKTRKEYPLENKSFDHITSKERVYTDNMFIRNDPDQSPVLFQDVVYEMPNGGEKTVANGLEIDPILFAEFLGWFVSEGCLSEGKYIRITQNEKNKDIDSLRRVLTKCGFSVYEKKQSNKRAIDFIFSHRDLFRWLKLNCYTGLEKTNCYNKRVPDWVRHGSMSVIDSFLNAHCLGDGYRHHGMRMHITSSTQLAYDIQECYLMSGINANIRVKQKRGSVSYIEGRKITRTTDIFIVSELKHEVSIGKPKIKNIREERVYNLEIDSPTKLYFVLFEGKTPFWVHNGGAIDILKCKGFVNNSRPIKTDSAKKLDTNIENYANLKSQCYYKLSERLNAREMHFAATVDTSVTERLTADLEQVKQANMDSDGKKAVLPKEKVKELLGRSPDFSDCLMMREYFELKPAKAWVVL